MNLLGSPKNQALLYSLFFLIFGIFRVHYHELWSDETEPWLLARDSSSYLNLLFNKRYEGHPNLWYSLLYPLAHLELPVQSMQYLHLLFSTSVTYIFIRFAPFPLVIRLVFCLGYFPLYEYGTISRIYAPGLLCIFSLCALFHQRYKYWLWFCLLLFICPQTNFFGALFAGALFLLTLLTFWFEDRKLFLGNEKPLSTGGLIAGFLIIIVGFVITMFSVKTPPDNTFARGWQTYWSLYRFNETVFRFWEAFFPIPEIKVAFWNTNMLANFKIKVFLSGLILLTVFLSLIRNLRVLLLYGFLSLTMVVFFYFKYQGFIRHHGHFYIFFVAALWLMQNSNSSKSQQVVLIPKKQSAKIANTFLLLLVWVHLVVGAFATTMDFRFIFSGNKLIADYVKKKGENCLVVVEDNLFCSTISAYTGQKLYFLTERKFGSYFQFDEHISYRPSYNQMLDISYALSKKRKTSVVIVLYKNMDLRQFTYPIRKVMFTPPGIVGDPGYYVYEIPFTKISP